MKTVYLSAVRDLLLTCERRCVGRKDCCVEWRN